MDLVGRLFEGELFWLVAADYERTKPEFFYIVDCLSKLGLKFTHTKQIDPGEIQVADIGARILTKSAKDPRKLAAEAPNFILGCEASQLDYETYLRLRGRLAEKRGSMLLSGTFEGSLGWYVDLFQRGQSPNQEDLVSFSMPTWTNTVVFPGGETDPEILQLKAQFSEEWFNERFGGIPTPPRGLVFPEFRTYLHTGTDTIFRFDPGLPVHIWVDPGYSHAHAVLFAQQHGEIVTVFDELYETGLVTEDMITLMEKKPWYGRAQIAGGAIDVAGTQHQAMSSPQETWLRQGGIYLQSKKVRIPDGIERVKTSLKVNPLTGTAGLLINTACTGLISELGGCPNPIDGTTRVYKWKMDKGGTVVGDVPEDKNNDACKALSYGLVDMLGFTPKKQAKAKLIRAK
jgi:hypothetical protein